MAVPMPRGDARRGKQGQVGFTYLGLLLAVAVMGLWRSAASEVWVKVAQRQRDEHARWCVDQLNTAIASYRDASPAGPQDPVRLEDLLEDRRFGVLRRHLRALYADPLTGRPDWQVQRGADGRIRAVAPRVVDR